MKNTSSEEEMLARYRNLYPGKSDEDLRQVRERFRNLLLIARRIVERLRLEDNPTEATVDS